MIEIRKTVTFKVDPARWAETFGLSLGEVAEDFQSYLDGDGIAQTLQEVMGSLDYCGGKVDVEDREHAARRAAAGTISFSSGIVCSWCLRGGVDVHPVMDELRPTDEHVCPSCRAKGYHLVEAP